MPWEQYRVEMEGVLQKGPPSREARSHHAFERYAEEKMRCPARLGAAQVADGRIGVTPTETLGLMAVEGRLTLSAHETGFIG